MPCQRQRWQLERKREMEKEKETEMQTAKAVGEADKVDARVPIMATSKRGRHDE